MKHTKTYKIRETECDPKYLCRLASLWDLMQETAGEHSELLGVGHEAMQKTGYFFALMRMQCEVFRYPKFEEEIKIETQALGTEKVHVIRCYDVFDNANNLIARANSGWVIVSIDNLRIARPEQAYPELLKDKTEGLLPNKIVLGDLPFIRKIRAEFCDIDANLHVNNSRYINWLENEMGGEKISFVNTNYNSEVKMHEELNALLSGSQFALQNSAEKICFSADFKTFAPYKR